MPLGWGIWSIDLVQIAGISFYDRTWWFFIQILMETYSLGTVWYPVPNIHRKKFVRWFADSSSTILVIHQLFFLFKIILLAAIQKSSYELFKINFSVLRMWLLYYECNRIFLAYYATKLITTLIRIQTPWCFKFKTFFSVLYFVVIS